MENPESTNTAQSPKVAPEPASTKKPSVEEMMAESLKLTKEVHEMMQKTRRYIAIRTIMSVVYFVLIIAPIILAAIYLPPLIKPALQQYQSILDVTSGTGATSGLDFTQLLDLLDNN